MLDKIDSLEIILQGETFRCYIDGSYRKYVDMDMFIKETFNSLKLKINQIAHVT